jgi:two-component system response regulator YesN
MNELIIVDDDPMVCQGLSVILPWEEYGFSIGGTFSNGSLALRHLLENDTDLVITDIKMPEMNGVELIEEIRRRSLACQVLILSGYDDYEYLKMAIRFDVVSYLLKPVQILELKSNILLVNERLHTRRSREFVEEGLEELKNTLFQRILSHQIQETEMRNKLEFLGIPNILDWEEFIVALPNTELIDRGRHDHPNLISFRDWESNLVFISESAHMLEAQFPPRLSGEQVIWIGDSVRKIMDLSLTYHSAWQNRLSFRQYEDDTELNSDPQTAEDIKHHLYRRIESEHNLQDAREAVFAGLLNLSSTVSLDKLGLTFRFFSTANDREMLRDRVDTLCDQIALMDSNKKDRTENATVNDVILYVHLHLDEGISLSIIADHLGMNPSYLGQLFHEVTGSKFTLYVRDKRMDKARRLLQETSTKVGAIAELCGFTDVHYFSKVFTTTVGHSPKEFREDAMNQKHT